MILPGHAETADSLSLGMLVLLESLSPEQRAVLLLHDVFDYGYPEIAAMVGKSEDNVRQLATRQTPHQAAPAPLPNDARTTRQAGPTVLRGNRAGRSSRARGAARSRRGADRRRRRQGPGAARSLRGRVASPAR